jgi:hypothetical protein
LSRLSRDFSCYRCPKVLVSAPFADTTARTYCARTVLLLIGSSHVQLDVPHASSLHNFGLFQQPASENHLRQVAQTKHFRPRGGFPLHRGPLSFMGLQILNRFSDVVIAIQTANRDRLLSALQLSIDVTVLSTAVCFRSRKQCQCRAVAWCESEARNATMRALPGSGR